MRRSALLGAAITGVLSACGGGGGGGAPASGGGGAAVTPGGGLGPVLVSAQLDDRDASGSASQGDAIVLGFDRHIDASGLGIAALRLLDPADSLGSGAAVAPGTTGSEALLTLGAGAAIALYDTYDVGSTRAPRSPGAISVDAGAVRGLDGTLGRAGRPAPVLLPPAARSRFQPEQSRGTFSPFAGQMHSHTTYSDGSSGVPADAYDMARFQAGLDWFAVTDHMEYLLLQPWKWDQSKQQAAGRTVDGTFVAIPGYEWGHGLKSLIPPVFYNHTNVLSDDLVDFVTSASLDGLYQEVANLPGDAIGKFNHPNVGTKSSGSITVKVDDWDDYRHDGAADRHFHFVRVMKGTWNDAAGYLRFLDHGWHIAPGYGEDNHHPDWGLSDRRMGVYAAQLTRDSLKEAMRARRTYTSSDRDAWVRLMAEDPGGDLWMGSTVCGPGPVKLEIECGDPTDPIDSLEIVTAGGTVATTAPVGAAGTFTFEWDADPSEDAYYYVRLTEADGDLIYSAPIFIDR